MPITNGIGHSSATLSKQEGLRCVLDLHLKICRSILSRWNGVYHYADLNAGSGVNPEGCNGSPLVFLGAADAVALPYRAHLIEMDPGNALMLRGEVGCKPNVTVHTGDNAVILPRLLSSLKRGSYGLIYSDPNSHSDEDFALLAKAASAEKIDILMRYTGAATKRAGRERLLDALSRIDKKHKLVRCLEGKWQWTFLLLTNWTSFPEWRQKGFYSAASDEGQQILHQLHYTNAERKVFYQPSLPYATYAEYLQHPEYRAVRQAAVDRAQGT